MAPRKKEGTPKTKVVALRVTPDEHKILKDKANEAGLTMSDFLFAAAYKKEINVLDMEVLKNLLYELQKVGVNLNQMMILCHKGKITYPNINEVISLQNELLAEIRKLLSQANLKKEGV